jgi:hypothetical protein
MTIYFFRFLYALAIDKTTLEPRRGLFFLFYYVIGFFVAFIVLSMVLLCLEAYDISFAREFIYKQLGEPLLYAIETLIF